MKSMYYILSKKKSGGDINAWIISFMICRSIFLFIMGLAHSINDTYQCCKQCVFNLTCIIHASSKRSSVFYE